jgi:hypothetical protein
MIEYSDQIVVFIASTLAYMFGVWRGSKSPSESLIDDIITNTVIHTTDQLIADGYICTNEVERDGKMVSVIVPYEEYIKLIT